MEAEAGSGCETDAMKVVTDATKEDTLNGVMKLMKDVAIEVTQKLMKDVAIEVTPVTCDVATNTDEPNKIKPVARVEPILREDLKCTESTSSSEDTSSSDTSSDIVPGPVMPATIYVASVLSTNPASSNSSPSYMPDYLQQFHPSKFHLTYSSTAPEHAMSLVTYISILLLITMYRFKIRRFWHPSNTENRLILRQSFRTILWLLRNLTTEYARFFGNSPTEVEGLRMLRSLYGKARRIGRMFWRLKVPWYRRNGHENSDPDIEADDDDSEAEYAPARRNGYGNLVPAVKRYMTGIRKMLFTEETIPFKLDASTPLIRIVISEFLSFRTEVLGAYLGSNRFRDNFRDPLSFIDLT